MTIDPNEAATSLHDIATVERRTHEALFYGGSSGVFVMWGGLVAAGFALAGLYSRSAMIIWLSPTAAGRSATPLIVSFSPRPRPPPHPRQPARLGPGP